MPVVATREDYFVTAMALLAAEGHGALKIGTLCRSLGVTTGSFYHYFGSLDGFIEGFLEYWEQERTARVIALANVASDATERMSRLKALALEVDHDSEGAIRAWANSNARVAEVQKRVDQERFDALREVIFGVVPDRARAQMLAVMGISMLVGLPLWRSPVDRGEISRVFDEFEQSILRHVAEITDSPSS
jgi:AcrR family transcriptional regulator